MDDSHENRIGDVFMEVGLQDGQMFVGLFQLR